MFATNLALGDNRAVDRDEVHYHARAFGPNGERLTLLVVNISPLGLMARCSQEFAAGQRLRITLPSVGTVTAEARWSLGGRTGCQFMQTIDRAAYYLMLAAMMRQG